MIRPLLGVKRKTCIQDAGVPDREEIEMLEVDTGKFDDIKLCKEPIKRQNSAKFSSNRLVFD